MKKILRALCLLLAFHLPDAFAGTINGASYAASAPRETTTRIPFEFDSEYAYLSDARVARGSRDIRDFDETYALVRFVYTPRVKLGILRLGAAWEYFTFGFPANVQLEDTLQSASLVVGLDTEIFDSILIRLEAQPGFYGSSDIWDDDTFMVPFVIGGTYIYSSDLQFVLGVSVNLDRNTPVFPGGGLRWRLASQWVLNAVLPTPRLEFQYSPNLLFFLGGNLKGSTFRVGKTFGTRQAGDARLNNAVIDYLEVRIGAGVEIKIAPEVKLTFEGGYVPYREFDYHRTPVRYHHEEGSAYASVAFRAAF